MLKKMLRAAALSIATLTVAAAPIAAHAVEVEGFDFPSTAAVGGQSLALNGAAVSSILSTRSTVVGLYLTNKQNTMEGAVGLKGPKRIQFYMLRSVSSRDLSNALLDRIRQNVPAEEFRANIMATSELGAVFNTRAKLAKGDLVVIDYNPGTQQTDFTVNGQKLGEPIKGDTFFPMLMKVWIGPNVRGATRDGLLGVN